MRNCDIGPYSYANEVIDHAFWDTCVSSAWGLTSVALQEAAQHAAVAFANEGGFSFLWPRGLSVAGALLSLIYPSIEPFADEEGRTRLRFTLGGPARAFYDIYTDAGPNVVGRYCPSALLAYRILGGRVYVPYTFSQAHHEIYEQDAFSERYWEGDVTRQETVESISEHGHKYKRRTVVIKTIGRGWETSRGGSHPAASVQGTPEHPAILRLQTERSGTAK